MAEKSAAADSQSQQREFTPAEIGALAHLYRGEVYRSTIWRTRLDTTTNWAVVTLGVALSISFASPEASALPLLLVGVLIALFMVLEARRYRYFNVWRARSRWLETHFYAPMLEDGDLHCEENWQKTLANDYWKPQYHISFLVALGRRVRRNYMWILAIQYMAYWGKLIVHPTKVENLHDILARAAVGPLPGWLVLLTGLVYLAGLFTLAQFTRMGDAKRTKARGGNQALG